MMCFSGSVSHAPRMVYPSALPSFASPMPFRNAILVHIAAVLVILAAVLALDDQPAYPDRGQQGLVDLQIGEVFQHVLPLDLGQRVEWGVVARIVQPRSRIGRVAVERVDGLVVHPLTVDPTLAARAPRRSRWPHRRRPVAGEGGPAQWVR